LPDNNSPSLDAPISTTGWPGMEPIGGRTVRGVLDMISGRTVDGWAADTLMPDQPVTIEIFADDRLLGTTEAVMFRADLAQAGLGTGHHHFSFLLPPELFDGNDHLISARVQGTNQNLENSPTRLALALPATAGVMAEGLDGMLDAVTEDGWVQGWAWYPGAPERRAEIEILLDGVVAGSTLAASHRPDLAAAGMADGNYGFSFALPFETIAQAREALISVRERESGQGFATPRLFRRRVVTDAMEKITALEDDVRLLRGSLEQARAQQMADERGSAELFRAVGDFFVQLAEAAEAGRPAGPMRTLRGAIEDVTSEFAPLEFEYPAEPALSLCVEARGSVAMIYETLRALRGIAVGHATEVVLFDTGGCEDAPLLPLVARNLRYLHIDNKMAQPASRNQVAAFARGSILVFLTANAAPVTSWIGHVLSAFSSDEALAMLGAKILRGDGVLEHAGSLRRSGGKLVLGLGKDPSDNAFAERRPIDGVAPDAFAVRAGTWREIGGLDESIDDLAQALDAFCEQVAAKGGGILYEPDFSFVLNEI
jgi:hypothetical protein